MKRITMFYRNGYKQSFRTTEDSAVRIFSDFCASADILVQKYELYNGTPLLKSGEWVDADEIRRIEIGRVTD
ncbi:hypothetical protein [Glycomyces sp. NPDC021274]|uniref:hypothetical protein n=1 Tax=Glycomyces sp. NPDC021274 TaxID=3155120 RepID=UPI0033DBC0CF